MIGLMAMLHAASADPRCAAHVSFYQPPHGMISTPRIAKQVARIYLDAIYGAGTIAHELPLKVAISREVWHVEGTLASNSVGGVAEIELCQSSGQVLRVFHGK